MGQALNYVHWRMYEVLTEKYEWSTRDAAEFADFLLPMLDYNIYERATALECLNHPWITRNYPGKKKTRL